MNKIDFILSSCISNKKINIVNLNNKRIIKDSVFFSISISLEENDTVFMYFRWQFGILGKIMFKTKFKEMNTLYTSIKSKLIENNFELNEPHFVSQF